MGSEFSNRRGYFNSIRYPKYIQMYFKESGKSLSLLLIFITLGVVIGSITPYLYGNIIDCIISDNVADLKKMLLFFFFLNILSIILSICENIIGSKVTISISNKIKHMLFIKILHMKPKEQDQYSSGEFLNRIEGDADSVVSYYINFFTSCLMIIINLIVSVFFLIKISRGLTIIAVLLLPTNYFINFIFKNRIRLYKRMEKQKDDKYFQFVNMVLEHLKNIKILLLENGFAEKFKNIRDEQYEIQVKNLYLSSVISFTQQVFNQIFEIIIVFISAILIINGSLTIGMMVSFNSYLEKLFAAISKLLSLNLEKQSLAVSVERIEKIENKESETCEIGSRIECVKRLQFDNVNFGYIGKNVLSKISFIVETNGLYSLVGENGAGKTTILKLISKLYEPDSGTISFNHKNLKELNVIEVRSSIAYMMKEVLIVQGSLYENIILGHSENIDESEVQKICQKLQLENLKSKIGGIHGEINARIISSGEKQKIGLARNFFQSANLILLDEVTSDMDGGIEKSIITILKELAKTKIIINVCHRRELAEASKKIFVLNRGSIIESGNHKELIEKKGIYYNLFGSKSFN